MEYTLRSLSNLMGEKRRRQADGSAGSGAAAAGERSLIAAESCSSLNSAASGGELERAARRQFQQDETPGFVYVVSVFSALGGFLFGYDTGVVSGALLLLKRELNLDALWQELLVSSTVGAAALSALAGGVLNGLCGRRPCILLASGLFTAGAGVLAAARDKETLLGGRVVVGLGIGECRAVPPGPSGHCSPSPAPGGTPAAAPGGEELPQEAGVTEPKARASTARLCEAARRPKANSGRGAGSAELLAGGVCDRAAVSTESAGERERVCECECVLCPLVAGRCCVRVVWFLY